MCLLMCINLFWFPFQTNMTEKVKHNQHYSLLKWTISAGIDCTHQQNVSLQLIFSPGTTL